MTTFVNLTPHYIVVRQRGNGLNFSDTTDWTLPRSGKVARLEEFDKRREAVCVPGPDEWPDGAWFDLTYRSLGSIFDLPEPVEGTIYIVSTAVAQVAGRFGRSDVWSPDTGSGAIREEGRIIAVHGFVSFLVTRISAADRESNYAAEQV